MPGEHHGVGDAQGRASSPLPRWCGYYRTHLADNAKRPFSCDLQKFGCVDELVVDLHGDVAGILQIAASDKKGSGSGKKSATENEKGRLQEMALLKMVAGTRNPLNEKAAPEGTALLKMVAGVDLNLRPSGYAPLPKLEKPERIQRQVPRYVPVLCHAGFSGWGFLGAASPGFGLQSEVTASFLFLPIEFLDVGLQRRIVVDSEEAQR